MEAKCEIILDSPETIHKMLRWSFKYHVSDRLKRISKHDSKPIEEDAKALQEQIQNVQEHTVMNSNQTGESPNLPIEILFNILGFGSAIRPMMELNKTYYHQLAAFLYPNIHCIITLTQNRKVILNDICALTVEGGKHNVDDMKDFDPYSLYLRLRQAKKYKYEFIETESFRYTWSKRSETDPVVVTKLDDVLNIAETMNNPSSLMRRYNRKLSIDFHILDGYEVLEEQNLVFSSTVKDHCDSSEAKLITFESKDLYVVPTYHSDYFGGLRRWVRPPFRWEGIQELVPEDQFDKMISRSYPENVYLKEFYNNSRLFDALASGERSKLFKVENSQQLNDLEILKYESPPLTIDEIDVRFRDFPGHHYYKKTTKHLHHSLLDVSSVDITGRKFSSEVETRTIIEKVIKAITNDNECTDHIERTLCFTGYEDPHIETAIDSYQVKYRPLMTLIRK